MFVMERETIFWMRFEYFFLFLLYSPVIYLFLKHVVWKRCVPWVVKKLKELDARVESRQKT